MVKEIDIRKARQDPLDKKNIGDPLKEIPYPKVEKDGVVHIQGPVHPDDKTFIYPPSHTQKTQSFISRFLDIMVCDIMVLFRRPLSEKQEDIIRKTRDFEKFEEFCKKARGEK